KDQGISEETFVDKLKMCVELKDVDAVKVLLQYYIENNKFKEANELFSSLNKHSLLNKTDSSNCEKAYANAIKEKILKLILPNTSISEEIIKPINKSVDLINDPLLNRSCRSWLKTLQKRKLKQDIKADRNKEKIKLVGDYIQAMKNSDKNELVKLNKEADR